MKDTDNILLSKAEEVTLTANIVSAYVANNPVPAQNLGSLIEAVHESLKRLGQEAPLVEEQQARPAVNPKRSVQRDYLVCLEDGKKFKSLKRHLMSHHGLTPQQYREKWNLPADYPMVAPDYSAQRSDLARKVGLGKRAGEEPEPVKPKRGRPKKSST
ncbi:MucR family transcriptional regulator [Aquamicrobium zhengzhouense]|uniref:MucR family transcriptional regulator n=1 Tax=Aquamicrobium zhengzhouense TaxID=2781738 RepID=A0ABS0SEQ0_9HYPH|nr:MucR family transcriptional regulator [Aquamicrobium zhengzhouense]MBI1621726.1 MucR family transcriptional regulator [Aquamicrobium zhengzhouense]